MTEPDYKEWAEWILVEIYELDLTREQQKKRITEALEAIAMQKYWQGKREGREEYALERDIEAAQGLEGKRRKKVLQELEDDNDAELWESGVLGQSEEHVRRVSAEDEARIQESLGIINDAFKTGGLKKFKDSDDTWISEEMERWKEMDTWRKKREDK